MTTRSYMQKHTQKLIHMIYFGCMIEEHANRLVCLFVALLSSEIFMILLFFPFIYNFIGNSTMVMKARRMGGCMQNHIRKSPPPPPPPPSMMVAATPTPSPKTKTRSPPTGSFPNHTL